MKNLFLLLCVLFWCSSPSWAQATLDATASGQCDNAGCTAGTTLTIAVTTGAGSNRQMSVFVSIGCSGADTAPAVLSVTYDTTQSLLKTVGVTPVSARSIELWTLPAGTQPNSGTHNVVIVLTGPLSGTCTSGTSTLSGGVITSAGVDQTTPYASTPLTNSGTGTNPTLTGFTSGASDLGIEAICSGDTITSTAETIKWNNPSTANSCGSSGGATAAGGDTSFSWTITSDSWIIVGGALKASGGAAPPAIRKILLLGAGD